ncbi:arabinosyltransferase domain-containing protein [Hoyosella subflava]|uniref:Putative arabinosyltransferase B n=1 Tax=Hoyosella subflava (strain DSM 45089 / JCM 17490 / NBRC 109087 / DQS3-9A1) TaxID=443218 RepID=F6EEB8_HOYSD|nr:putative arabinosyltransferase B [Hoyosella subflava DQS3-9A1]
MESSKTGGSVTDSGVRAARIVALLTGLAGFLLAVATPLLPVHQTTTTISWPQDDQATSIEAPLISYLPVEVSATIPCAVFNDLPDEGGLVAATIPAQSPDSQRFGLQIRATETQAQIVARNSVLHSIPREQITGCDEIRLNITTNQLTTEFTGVAGSDDLASTTREGNFMPQVVGVFTDLEGPAPDGLNVTIEVDSRFTTSPTLLKILAITIGAIATLVSLAALHRLDLTDGRRHRRFLPASWWKLSPLDLIVGAILLGWYFIGANTADDGYILNMARVAGHAGYMANYYRWYGVPEAPFGWFYDVTAALAALSTASPFVRLTTLIASILCWWIISREVIPRLGRRARHTPAVYWTAAAVFLAFWLPYNNGLRPEPVIAVGALLTWISVERAIATGRLLPAAIATIIAAFSLAAGPTGLMAVAALLAGSRPLLAILIKRAKQLTPNTTTGNKHTPLASGRPHRPLLAAGTAVLFIIFYDQTLAAVSEASRLRTIIGPSNSWYNEFFRYSELFSQTADGSIARRFPVLIMIVCIFTAAAAIIHSASKSKLAKGPTLRLLAVSIMSFGFLAATPTKWVHHFGAFAGIGAAIAALAAVALTTPLFQSPRNRVLFTGIVVIIAAYAATGPNAYWYVGSFGVPWWDKRPSIQGYTLATGVLVFGLALLLVGAFLYLRYTEAQGKRKWFLVPLAAPIAVVTGLVVLFQFASLAKGAVSQYPSYSIGRSNVDAVLGEPCGLARDVLVETDPNDSFLTPVSTDDPVEAFTGQYSQGFDPNGFRIDLAPEDIEVRANGPSTIDPDGPFVTGGSLDARVLDEPGINGSLVPLPFGLDPSRIPTAGTHEAQQSNVAELTTDWYELPERSDATPLVVITAAGRIASVDSDGIDTYGQRVELEYGRSDGDDYEALGRIQPIDPGPSPMWRNLRVPMADIPPEADVVRVVARDADLEPRQWIGLTPPRVPQLETLQDIVGTTTPVLLDWTVGLHFPCQQPYLHRYGVAQNPEYRITPDRGVIAGANNWQSHPAGGSLGLTNTLNRPTTLASYLADDWRRDWGELIRYTPHVEEAAPADLEHSTELRWGRWTPGEISW